MHLVPSISPGPAVKAGSSLTQVTKSFTYFPKQLHKNMAGDPFLSDPSKKRKRTNRPLSGTKKARAPAGRAAEPDSEISSNSEDSGDDANQGFQGSEGELSSDEEFEAENAADKRRRLAKQYLENLKAQDIGDDDFDAEDLDRDILATRLQQDAAEGKGNVYKFFAEKLESQLLDLPRTSVRIGCKNLTSVAANYPFMYTVSKDIELIKWKLNSNNKPQRVKHVRGGLRFSNINTKTPSLNHHSDEILCVACSADGRYVVTGGKDGRLLIWSSENLTCLKVLETRAAVNAITFRRGTDQLYAACADLRIRTFSINQFAQLEILYGHQDNITDISSLAKEACVSVGSRDKSVMYWKIAEESRLTFRGGDSEKRTSKKTIDPATAHLPFHSEGSIDVVLMIDETHFVTGSDNGNISLWSRSKKKALYTRRLAHGLLPQFTPAQASAETQEDVAALQIPPAQPYWITSIYSVPYSDIFVSGSYDGQVRVWQLERDNLRSFELLGSISLKGCVVKICGAEVADDNKLLIFAATAKEHRLGRWLGKVEGRNAVTTLVFNI